MTSVERHTSTQRGMAVICSCGMTYYTDEAQQAHAIAELRQALETSEALVEIYRASQVKLALDADDLRKQVERLQRDLAEANENADKQVERIIELRRERSTWGRMKIAELATEVERQRERAEYHLSARQEDDRIIDDLHQQRTELGKTNRTLQAEKRTKEAQVVELTEWNERQRRIIENQKVYVGRLQGVDLGTEVIVKKSDLARMWEIMEGAPFSLSQLQQPIYDRIRGALDGTNALLTEEGEIEPACKYCDDTGYIGAESNPGRSYCTECVVGKVAQNRDHPERLVHRTSGEIQPVASKRPADAQASTDTAEEGSEPTERHIGKEQPRGGYLCSCGFRTGTLGGHQGHATRQLRVALNKTKQRVDEAEDQIKTLSDLASTQGGMINDLTSEKARIVFELKQTAEVNVQTIDRLSEQIVSLRTDLEKTQGDLGRSTDRERELQARNNRQKEIIERHALAKACPRCAVLVTDMDKHMRWHG